MYVAAAGKLTGRSIQLGQRKLKVSADTLRTTFGSKKLVLLNDVAAAAYGIGSLPPEKIKHVDGPRSSSSDLSGTAVIGIGTGFGFATLTGVDGILLPHAAEPTFARLPLSAHTLAIPGVDFMRNRVGDFLSGRGILALHQQLHGVRLADEIDAAALISTAESDVRVMQTLEKFFAMLGEVAETLILNSGSWNGLFFYGPLPQPLLKDRFARKFRSSLHRGGFLRRELKQVRVRVITEPEMTLLGLASAP